MANTAAVLRGELARSLIEDEMLELPPNWISCAARRVKTSTGLETIPCDFSELLVRLLYNAYKSKRARKFEKFAAAVRDGCASHYAQV